ncbi:hypothetical protein [Rhodocista pekingensis]|uniref:Uncharacterized protein n=1 Tax=Rhodocista pekingensis TaxID=201185 RepID=A0ABW2KXQ9_9PROT
MSAETWQTIAIIPIVLGALAWVLWRVVLPRPAIDRLRRLAGRPEAPKAAAGGCGGCSGCGGGCAPTSPRRH